MKDNQNSWKASDEKKHLGSTIEWWCPEVFFKTIKDDKSWCLNASFTEWNRNKQKASSLYKMTLFDQNNDTHFDYLDEKNKPLFTKKEKHQNVSLHFSDSYIEGAFPDYQMRFTDPDNEIMLKLEFQAKATPYWVAQKITGGWLPWGLGFYRYGFIPKCNVTGTLRIGKNRSPIKGLGYYEHVWGDFSFSNPVSMITSIKKTISIYAKLTGWWLLHREPKIPSSISFNNQNNPFGYDWAWAVLDNGWTIFYGNLMFWLMKGPAAGTLILSKDDHTYEEFCNIRFEYNKMRYMEEYDVYYPSEIKIIAEKDQQKICLCFTMTNKCRMFVNKFPREKYWLAFIIFEAPGKVTGYYSNGNNRIKLSGFCKVEPQRQISSLGYNALHLNLLLPPKGLGASFVFDSHFFKKRLNGKLELLPQPKTNFHIEKLCK